MPRNVARIDLIVVLTKSLTVFALYATVGAMTCLAQTRAEPVKATKSIADEKSPVDEAHPLYIPLKMAYQASEPLKEIQDYECAFIKRELVGKKLLKTTMKLKLREEP